MFEFILIALFQAVAGPPAPTPEAVTETPAAAAEHNGHANHGAETPAAAEETEATPETAPTTESTPAATQQQTTEERRERVCRDDASSGSRLRSRRRC